MPESSLGLVTKLPRRYQAAPEIPMTCAFGVLSESDEGEGGSSILAV